MRTKLLLLLTILCGFTGMAQSVGIIGSATPTGWDSDTDMATTDNITYTINMTFIAGEVKFRQDDAWATNWGAATFPTGTGVQNGPNIPVPAGTYDVTFNRTTGAYSFVGTTTFPSIGMLGTALGDDFAGPDTDMVTTDGVTYTLSGFTFEAGEAKFRQDDAWTNNWGAASFPSGTATLDGANIPVPAGTYTVTFNRNTLAYNFSFVNIGIIGTAVNGGWDSDVDMITTDGAIYQLTNYTLGDGLLKFRQDDSWTVNWGGGGINPNVLVLFGTDIPVTAGIYDITMNRNTLDFSINPSLGIAHNEARSFTVYPNPALSSWTVASSENIAAITVLDVAGKQVLSATPNATESTIDCSGLSSGIYFAKIASAKSVQTVKLVKQ